MVVFLEVFEPDDDGEVVLVVEPEDDGEVVEVVEPEDDGEVVEVVEVVVELAGFVAIARISEL